MCMASCSGKSVIRTKVIDFFVQIHILQSLFLLQNPCNYGTCASFYFAVVILLDPLSFLFMLFRFSVVGHWIYSFESQSQSLFLLLRLSVLLIWEIAYVTTAFCYATVEMLRCDQCHRAIAITNILIALRSSQGPREQWSHRPRGNNVLNRKFYYYGPIVLLSSRPDPFYKADLIVYRTFKWTCTRNPNPDAMSFYPRNLINHRAHI